MGGAKVLRRAEAHPYIRRGGVRFRLSQNQETGSQIAYHQGTAQIQGQGAHSRIPGGTARGIQDRRRGGDVFRARHRAAEKIGRGRRARQNRRRRRNEKDRRDGRAADVPPRLCRAAVGRARQACKTVKAQIAQTQAHKRAFGKAGSVYQRERRLRIHFVLCGCYRYARQSFRTHGIRRYGQPKVVVLSARRGTRKGRKKVFGRGRTRGVRHVVQAVRASRNACLGREVRQTARVRGRA